MAIPYATSGHITINGRLFTLYRARDSHGTSVETLAVDSKVVPRCQYHSTIVAAIDRYGFRDEVINALLAADRRHPELLGSTVVRIVQMLFKRAAGSSNVGAHTKFSSLTSDPDAFQLLLLLLEERFKVAAPADELQPTMTPNEIGVIINSKRSK